ncbi:MAG: YqzE family protein [Thermicanus sp.]|nr:YqzE family protein [Thermicanus sp.]
MASFNDLIRYMTQELVRYLDQPREGRKKKTKEPFSMRMFGLLPMAAKLAWDNRKKGEKKGGWVFGSMNIGGFLRKEKRKG